jgi:hypothetical protein
MVTKDSILIRRGYLPQYDTVTLTEAQAYAMEAFKVFGVRFNKPQLVTAQHLAILEGVFKRRVPHSFYANPQDTTHFTSDELALEQFISYVMIEYHHGVDSNVDEHFDRIELFKKVLPDYQEGKEFVERTFNIVDDKEQQTVLKQITDDLSSYTRPWNETEEHEFYWLYDNKYYSINIPLQARSNAIAMYQARKDPAFAACLDQKDLVKMSVEEFGNVKILQIPTARKDFYLTGVSHCKRGLLTKKQAKYFNSLCKAVGIKAHYDNFNSPYRKATPLVKAGAIVEAAKVFKAHGSMLERNLIWLLSRADIQQALDILDLIEVNNPVVALQFITSLTDTKAGPRTFSYYYNKRVRKYNETSEEARYRKSILSPAMKKLIQDHMIKKIQAFYMAKPSLGKVYVNPLFAKIGVPYNTSASGTGLGVIPTGSRIPIHADYIRTFVYWTDNRDVDAAMNMVHKNGQIMPLYWGSYSQHPFGPSALYSGDDRGVNGAEYQDFKLTELLDLGYTHGVFSLNGYGANLNQGEIYCGYQDKSDLNTRAWDPKNIKVQIKVSGDSRAFMAFAIDFKTSEMVILNQMLESGSRVTNPSELDAIKKYLDPNYLSAMNVKLIAEARGTVVSTPEEADYIFDDTYQPVDNQKVIRSTDIEKLVALLN